MKLRNKRDKVTLDLKCTCWRYSSGSSHWHLIGVKPYILNLISFYWHPLQVRLSRELVKCWISVDVGSCRQNSEMHDVSTHTLVEISCGSGWLTWLTVWEKLLPRLHDVCWICISTPQTSSKKSVLSIFLENGLAQAIQTQPAACFLIGELRQTI